MATTYLAGFNRSIRTDLDPDIGTYYRHYALRRIWMHAQAIDGSRQMQQTVERQYVCMVHSFREDGGPSINDVDNLEGEGSNYTLRCIWMHVQAIEGSRQMQQTVDRQYVCMVHSFRKRGGVHKRRWQFGGMHYGYFLDFCPKGI